MSDFKIINADVLVGLKSLPDNSVDCVFTSPPYFALRDYGVKGQIGLEETPYKYIEKLLEVFDEVKRVLKPTGTCWINLGDTYSSTRFTGEGKGQPMNKFKDGHRDINPEKNSGLEDKTLIGIPQRFMIGMIDRGWLLRNNIIWHKPSCMPSSIKDRFTVDFEYVFFFVKEKKYFFEQQLEPFTESTFIRAKANNNSDKRKDGGLATNWQGLTPESQNNWYSKIEDSGGRNMRCVWSINPEPYREAHFACFPTELVRRGLKAGSPKNGIVLDPFVGSGTTLFVAQEFGLKGIGIELNENYIPLMKKRLLGHENQTSLNPNKVEVIKL